MLAVSLLPSQTHAQNVDDLAELSLEELLDVEITSVSKKVEKRSDAAAAVYVLTNEDIKRSGATSIPEALRLVPGVHVARLDQNKWSVSSRGFSGRFANKLLVLIDGRSVYTPLFSGVYWEANDVMLEDVDRIEVIRGPGGTLWGANAVNGVINIVTKPSSETQGGVLKVGGGTEEQAFTSFRYGGTLGEDTTYRVYSKYFQRDEGNNFLDNEASDEWHAGQAGFRIDTQLNEQDSLTIQGDAFNLRQQQRSTGAFPQAPFIVSRTDQTDFHGANILGRWTRTMSEDSELQLQFYHDYYKSDTFAFNITDIEVQHRYRINDAHEIMYGGGFRDIRDSLESGLNVAYKDEHQVNDIFSAFIQDEWTATEKLTLIFGTKVEHNSYTGWEVQPSARFRWNPTGNQTVWGAVSRAVRTPSRAENDIFIVSGAFPPGAVAPTVPTLAVLAGSSGQRSEELIALELGYRIAPNERWAIDIATFYNDYDRLLSADLPFVVPGPLPNLPPQPPHALLVFGGNNSAQAETWGGEIGVDWLPRPWWKIRTAYSYFEIAMDLDPLSFNNTASKAKGNFPEQSAFVHSTMTVRENFDIDLVLRYVDRLSKLDIADYFDADLRLAWRPKDGLELSVVGQNLIGEDDFQFVADFIPTTQTQVQRGVYAQILWEF